MTQRLIRLLLLLMSVLMGWALGYIRVPFIDSNYAFWVGFVGCLGLMAFILALFQIRNNASTKNKPETGHSPLANPQNQWLNNNRYLSFFVVTFMLCLCVFIYSRNIIIKEELNRTTNALNDLKYNSNLEQERSKIFLILDLIHKLDSTIFKTHDTIAAANLADRIATLSTSFRINKTWDMENNVIQDLSLERGLLLLALVKTKMDSRYLNKIKENVSFYAADLRNADLHGLDLSGIDLKGANLQYANLHGINLSRANLNDANLVGANLNQALLVGTSMIGAKLNWAKINEADLKTAKLDSADLSNATLTKSKLTHATLLQAVLQNTIFNEADLDYCYFMYTNLTSVNFSKAILIHTTFSRTNLDGSILNDAITNENWIAYLREYKNNGVNTILNNYQILRDSLTIKDSIIYRITSKAN